MDDLLWKDLGVSADGLDKLHQYVALVEKWTVKINLISRMTVTDIWSRHIEDSARILTVAPKSPIIWADFGAGGGFPGIVVAILLKDRGLDSKIILVESDQRKSTFLREAARILNLNVEVKAERAEAIPEINADVVSARALASLDMLCGFAQRHMARDGVAIFPKGETWAEEVALARKNWIFDLVATDDPGHKGTAILQLRNINRVDRDAQS